MWNVPLLFLLYIINITVYRKRNTSLVSRYNVSSAVTNYIHILCPVLIKKANRKNHYQEKVSSELHKSERHSCQCLPSKTMFITPSTSPPSSKAQWTLSWAPFSVNPNHDHTNIKREKYDTGKPTQCFLWACKASKATMRGDTAEEPELQVWDTSCEQQQQQPRLCGDFQKAELHH